MEEDTIVLYAAPGMGHIISMVELGKLILNRYPGKFSITVLYTCGSLVDTPSIPAYIQHISRANPSISFHRFPRVENKITLIPISIVAITFDFIRRNDPHVRLALEEISKSSAIRAFIIDIFCSTALLMAKELGIPTYYFYTSGAAALAVFLYFPKIGEQTTKSFKDLTETVLEFPGLKSPLNAPHMPEAMLNRDDPGYWDMVYVCTHIPKSNGIIANTFEELEPSAVLKAIAGESGDCLSWLDQQPSRSVVFLCFGSRGSFSGAQLKEIADGLEKSGQRFLWVVKKPPLDEKTKQVHGVQDFDLEGLLPEGFLERTKDRGLVVKSWVPQVAVLKKESVGGFVTHCGWNSVLEAVIAGVPMVAWPLYAEQHLNRSVLVKDMEMAIAVEQREKDGFVFGDELERSVRELMESEKGRELRERSRTMGEMALAAWSESGSSTRNLANFVNSIP
ncbi:UDP-glycosyltransferase 88F5 [Prunus yedoensis var. nudiflora]|uniref:Glycosyltransferase n=1 Tax=Prunus yedoensis var. nudiflora TaxID=2094558 RepID=A0A314YB77_PRUYE|nr:UDP-glycosyltransferase 88F5 [Prunus yedoensis var. nudiflora]